MERPIVFIDLETTGVDVKKDRIVEISIIKTEKCDCICHSPNGFGAMHIVACCGIGQIKITNTITQRINPQIPIPESATAVHGITNEMVEFEPPFDHIANMLIEQLSTHDIAGFNSNGFDLKMLFAEFERCGIEWNHNNHRLIDVGNLFKILNPRTLGAAYKTYTGSEYRNGHSAENDVLATIEVFVRMLNKHDEIPKDIDELALYSNFGKKMLDLSGCFTYNEDGEIIFAFGKWVGCVASEQKGYLNWMLKSDFASDTKLIVNQILNGN